MREEIHVVLVEPPKLVSYIKRQLTWRPQMQPTLFGKYAMPKKDHEI